MSRSSNSVVRAIKQSIADQLLNQAYFATIPVFVVIPKDIFSQIEQGILPVSGGVAIFVEAFTAGPSDADNPGPYYRGGQITISVVESPTLNVANPDCDEVSETAQRYLQQFFPLGATDCCHVSNPSEVENAKLSIRRFYVQLPVGFTAVAMPLLPRILAAPAPGPLAYPQDVTLSLETAVPVLWILYTLDGTNPVQLNPSAHVCTGPITLTGPAKISARAYGPGYNSGGVTSFVFN